MVGDAVELLRDDRISARTLPRLDRPTNAAKCVANSPKKVHWATRSSYLAGQSHKEGAHVTCERVL